MDIVHSFDEKKEMPTKCTDTTALKILQTEFFSAALISELPFENFPMTAIDWNSTEQNLELMKEKPHVCTCSTIHHQPLFSAPSTFLNIH